jgi:hypothetical protein
MRALVPLGAKHAVRRVLGRPPAGARRYLRKGVTVDQFLRGLTGAGARYAVLRWFETLPDVEPGNDIDLLVSDEDLPAAEALLTPYRPYAAAQKVDLYSAGGRPGTTFGGAPYFPPALAARVLDGAVLLHDAYRVPAPADHLDSLAFHAVYHKGPASGLPSASTAAVTPAGRMAVTLERLARDSGLRLDLSLEGLERHLASRGLLPAEETVARLAAERARLYPA